MIVSDLISEQNGAILSNVCFDGYTTDAVETFSTKRAVSNTIKSDKRELGFSKMCSDVQTCYAHVTRRTAVIMLPRTKLKSVDIF